MERNERACEGEHTLDDYDMVECLACGRRVAHDLTEHPFFGFKAGCPLKRGRPAAPPAP
jgi:hypothetical protein